jgi:hypothetical protein
MRADEAQRKIINVLCSTGKLRDGEIVHGNFSGGFFFAFQLVILKWYMSIGGRNHDRLPMVWYYPLIISIQLQELRGALASGG